MSEPSGRERPGPGLFTVVREWGRIGCTGFGGPPTHIALLRELCVERMHWLDATEFEDAVAACNLLPGPASTQLAIFCAWRVRGRLAALAGGAAFIVPGLVLILALAALFLAASPPPWAKGAGAGAGAAVAAVAIQAGSRLVPASWQRAQSGSHLRWPFYFAAGAAAAATVGPWLVLILLACGIAELAVRWPPQRPRPHPRPSGPEHPGPARPPGRPRAQQPPGLGAYCTAALALLRPAGVLRLAVLLRPAAVLGAGVLLSLAWVAFKVGALSYGGGFVIVPLMQADAVVHYRWLTAGQFASAVALGQITPGPVIQTVAVVGYAAAGFGGGILAAVIAFAPSFGFVLAGGQHFKRLRTNAGASAFLGGAGPAAIGAIFGSALPLARGISEPWQYGVLAGAAVLLLLLRRGVVLTLLCAGAAGTVVALVGGPLPR